MITSSNAPDPVPQTEDAVDQRRFARIAGFVAVATAAAAALLVLVRGPSVLGVVVVALGALLFSKLAILGGGLDRNPFNPWELAALSSFLDLWLSCLVLAGVAGTEKLPLVGSWVRDARGRAEASLRTYPGLKRLAVWGVGLLVFLPLPGSGSITGSFAGRLVGLSRAQTFGAVAGGAVLACLLYAAVAATLDRHGRAMLEQPWVTAAATATLVIVGVLSWRRVRRDLEKP